MNVATPRIVACVIPQVFHGISTEVTVTESSTVRLSRRLSYPFLNILEHISSQDDGNILVGRTDVEEQSRCDSRRYQPDCPFHKAQKYGSDAAQHSACRHRPAEAHGTKDQPNRIHHA